MFYKDLCDEMGRKNELLMFQNGMLQRTVFELGKVRKEEDEKLVREMRRADEAEEKVIRITEKCRVKVEEMEREFREITYTMKWRN